MMKTALVSLLVLGSVSVVEAMPASPAVSGVSTMPIVKAEVVVTRRVVRRPVVRRVRRPAIIVR